MSMRITPEFNNSRPLRSGDPARVHVAAHYYHAVPDKIMAQVVLARLVARRGRQSGLLLGRLRLLLIRLFLLSIRRQRLRAEPALARLPLLRRGPLAEDQQYSAAFDVTPQSVLNRRRRREQIVAVHN